MTALVFENIGQLSAVAQSLRALLGRLGRAIDALVSAKAARAVPEWQMQAVQDEVRHHLNHVRTAKRRRNRRPRKPTEFVASFRKESAICNFSR